MFNRIAPTYDLLNDCISFGMHRGWKRRACDALSLKPGNSVLDVCTGTGDLINPLLERVGSSGKVTGLDFSGEMLAVAQKRFAEAPVTLVRGDALALPFADNEFDGAIISFGLRNVSDIPKALSEMVRVVKPGGWVVNLDTNPKPALPGYWLYFSWIMPRIGQFISRDASAYEYLCQSTQRFLTPDELVTRFEALGLKQVSKNAQSLGAVAMQRGQKPFSYNIV